MDKVAKLKSIAKGLAAEVDGVRGVTSVMSAHENIAKNKRNAAAHKGWATRRRRAIGGTYGR